MRPPCPPRLQPELTTFPGVAPRRVTPPRGATRVLADAPPPRRLVEPFDTCSPALASYRLECLPSCSCRGRG